jgi:predicted dehydrogenase
MNKIKRRAFVQSAGLGAITLVAGQQSARAANKGQKCVIGVIGTGGMGTAHLKTLAKSNDAEVAYVCDVDKDRLAAAVSIVASIAGNMPKPVGDLRKVLDAQNVDAVYIATPDHWHAPAAILALAAGKHVYVEKPCCHNVREGRLLVDAAKRASKVLQVGTQSRSAPFLQEAIQRLHEGAIGEVLVAKAWNSQRRGSIGKTQPSQPPPQLDFDGWVGPAPMVPYRSNMLPGIWRWWYDFGCGDIGNDGVHDIDVALWGLGVQTHPARITCLGGKNFFDDDQQFSDTQYAVCEYPRGRAPSGRTTQLIFEQRIWSPYLQEGYEAGVAFYGTSGMLLVGHVKGWKLYGERNKLIAERTGEPKLADHYDNFFACIRGDARRPAADAETGHRAATICHLANISARVGRVLNFNSESETIRDDDPANAMLHRRYREGHWAVPHGVA